MHDQDRAAGSRTILTVRRLDCRWPFGDPKAGDFSLCGFPIARGAFCVTHAARAYRAAPGGSGGLSGLADLM